MYRYYLTYPKFLKSFCLNFKIYNYIKSDTQRHMLVSLLNFPNITFQSGIIDQFYQFHLELIQYLQHQYFLQLVQRLAPGITTSNDGRVKQNAYDIRN